MPSVDEFQFKIDQFLLKIERINHVAQDSERNPDDRKKSSLLMAMTKNLEDYYNEYTGVVQQFSAFCSRQDPVLEKDFEGMIETFEAAYYNIQAILILNDRRRKDEANRASHSDLQNQASNVHAAVPPQSHVNLPTLPLCSFNGNPLEWQTFYDVFLGAVHNNPSLPEISKFMYLKSVLRDEPLSLIAAIPITAANYTVAWSTIQSRYKDDNRLTNAYLEAILDFNAVARDAADLRTFSTSLIEYKGALEALGHVVENWSVPLIFLLRRKLNVGLREKWEKLSLELTQPSLKDFLSFLENEAKALEAAKLMPAQDKSNKCGPSSSSNRQGVRTSRNYTSLVAHTRSDVKHQSNCKLCKQSHKNLWSCKEFLNRSVKSRFVFVKQNKLCLKCFDHNHRAKECSSESCRTCKGLHNRLLCFRLCTSEDQPKICENSSPMPLVENPSGSVPPHINSAPDRDIRETTDHVNNASLQTLASTMNSQPSVMLATAQVLIADKNGIFQNFTAVLDSGSQGSFATENCVKKLGLPVNKFSVSIFGFGKSNPVKVKGLVDINLKSKFLTYSYSNFKVEAMVVDHIVDRPSQAFPVHEWAHLNNLELADPDFDKIKSIDLLFGADCFASLVVGAPIKGPDGTPDLLPTVFGHCLMGKVSSNRSQKSLNVLSTSLKQEDELDSLLRQFWELQEIPTRAIMSEEDRLCEEYYLSSVGRFGNKYVVKLPIRGPTPTLGDSYALTRRRFELLENRLSKNPKLRKKYVDFMQEYFDLEQMVEATKPPSDFSFFIPHHCIYKKDGDFSKFRVVFDCSMKSSNGKSLNDILYPGSKLQINILDILFRFRFHSVVLIADIRQMYRNIRVHESQFDLQRILCRSDPSEKLNEYWLTTLTFGENCAPWLAIRTLHQLVTDHGLNFPAASNAVMNCTWMDDITTSVSSVQEGLELRTQLIELMAQGGLELRKWQSNRPELLEDLAPEIRALDPSLFYFQESPEITTAILGLVWNPVTDSFTYKLSPNWGPVTKRSILSEVARWYDPLGFIAPIVFYGKFLIQHLWQLGLGWDETPPADVIEKWNKIRNELSVIAEFEINRNFNLESAMEVQLHAFADASEKGYCAMVFLRIVYQDCTTSVFLLIAKSKVAPIRKLTLPRLELCALVMATQLMDYTRKILEPHCNISNIFIWSDSTVALRWVKSSPHKWKTFVANRTSRIQEVIAPNRFNYVPTAENPSDIGSRGALPRQFMECDLWKHGPEWLLRPENQWSTQTNLSQPKSEELEVEARIITLMTNISKSDWILKFSSFARLRNCLAWWMRFIHNSKKPTHGKSGILTNEELRLAEIRLLQIVQSEGFPTEVQSLRSGKRLPKNLGKLNPFLDENSLMRVGGRLKNAAISFGEKHPILLPKGHHVTQLIIDFYHSSYLHPGASNLHGIIRRKFWIMNGREVIRRRVAKCVKCFRTNPQNQPPLMGDLPKSRLSRMNPFSISGVDFGGPFEIKTSNLRSSKTLKSYICLFVCFATHAVHLELVSDLSADAFLAALRRFVARRGAVKEIHSDCGTNFVGAQRKLAAWANQASPEENRQIRNFLQEQNISWKFLPPGSPHMGGIWERGIRSVKQHLVRVIGEQRLTFEEFYTVLVQIEGVLNSRPLTPLSSDPNDLEALTPGHFLLQEPVSTIPYVEDHPIKMSHRWTLVQQIVNSIWKRWQLEYINSLQTRPKWHEGRENLNVGDLVVLKEPNMPPCRWPLGRVIRVFPGSDSVARVAEVRTRAGLFRRPVVKLCPLPIEQ